VTRAVALAIAVALAWLALAPGAVPGSALAEAHAPLPACSYDDHVLAGDPWRDHAELLLDTSHRLPDTPDPPDLVSVRRAGFASDHLVRAIVLDDLRALRQAAEAAGLTLEVQSAYRSFSYQRQVFAGWVERLGEAQALRVSARPGHSEHQLGTAIDLRSRGGPAPWDLDDWGRTPEGAWLLENAHRFGFVLSYPQGEEDRTCYDYEPWHYRWLGRERAALVHASGEPLRAWLWRHHPPRVREP
jgi:zinc D-Ala-D-Ala carboxypeptidase